MKKVIHSKKLSEAIKAGVPKEELPEAPAFETQRMSLNVDNRLSQELPESDDEINESFNESLASFNDEDDAPQAQEVQKMLQAENKNEEVKMSLDADFKSV